MEKLIIEADDEDAPLEFELDGEVVTLGRNVENRISIQNRYLSQFHARFSRLEGKDGREVLDLDSYNGTKVNGQRIVRAMVKSGDTIQFGLLTARYEKENNGRSGSAGPAAARDTRSSADNEKKLKAATRKTDKVSLDSAADAEIIEHNPLKQAIDRARTHLDPATPAPPRPHRNGNGIGNGIGNGSAKPVDPGADERERERERERARSEIERERVREAMATEQAELATLEKESTTKRGELETTEKSLAEARGAVQSANKELAEARNSLANLQALTEAERSGLNSIGEQIKQLREQGDKVKGVEHSLAAKLDELQDATLELERLKSAILRTNKEAETAKLALATSREDLQNAMSEHHTIVVRVAEARGDLEMLESEIKQKSNEIVRIRADRAHLQPLLDDEIRRLEEHTTEQTTINLELEQATRKLSRIRFEIGDAENQLDAITRESAEKERAAKAKLDELNETLMRQTLQAEKQEAMAEEVQRRVEAELARANAAAEERAAAAAAEAEGNRQGVTDEAKGEHGQAEAEAAPTPKSGKSLAEELIDLGFHLEPIKRKSDEA